MLENTKSEVQPVNVDKQTRIEMALRFLNLIFGAVVERIFGYLWTKQDKATYPFAVSNPAEREAMARKAIELSDEGKDVYFGVNLMNDTARAIDFLKSFVAGSEKYFWRTIKNSTTGRKEDICHYTADGYGKFLGKGGVAFLPHALKMILEEKGGFKSAEKLIAEFYDKRYLRTRNGRYKVQTWINGKPVWTYNFAPMKTIQQRRFLSMVRHVRSG